MAQPPVQMGPAQLNALIAATQTRGKRLTPLSSANPDDWIAWRGTFEKVALLNNWNDDTQRNQIAAAMEGVARRMVGDIPTNAGLPAALLDAYQMRFLPAAQSRLAVIQFRQAKQKEDESEIEYHVRLRELFSRAYPAEDVEASILLRETYTLGLKNTQILDHVYTTAPATYAACLTAATNKAAVLSVIATQTGGGGGGRRAHQGGAHAVDFEASVGGCWECGAKDHFKRACPKWKKKVADAKRQQGGGGGGAGGAGTGRGRGGRGRGGRGAGRGGRGGGGRGGQKKGGVSQVEEEADGYEGDYDEEAQGN